MFHPFNAPLSATPPAHFTYPYAYTPHPLVVQAANQMCNHIRQHPEWCEELDEGKMLGVLVARHQNGEIGFVAAYSGLLQGRNDLPYFAPAVYDFLQPSSHFITQEAHINQINREVSTLQMSTEWQEAHRLLDQAQQAAATEIARLQQEMQHAKARRDALRKANPPISYDENELTSESQHLKGELRRLKQHHRNIIEQAQQRADCLEQRLRKLKEKRKLASDALQRWIFEQFKMLNILGEQQNLLQIFQATPTGTPPAGAGECALPKMLQYAFLNQLRPLCFGEFWWGKSPKNEVRHHHHFYPSCSGKCKPILTHMLKGIDIDPNPLSHSEPPAGQTLEILYEDTDIVVVNKPSGMLSVPGTTEAQSAYNLLKPTREELLVVHRLDMDTSGILVFAKNKAAHYDLQRQFSLRETKKIYIALVEGQPTISEGILKLPLSPDPLDRPRQLVDHTGGKPAITRFKTLGTQHNYPTVTTRLQLTPLTGRTHQLRVHCAHHEGLNTPILGDRLYGNTNATQRLMLHAEQLTLKHPVRHTTLRFKAAAPF